MLWNLAACHSFTRLDRCNAVRPSKAFDPITDPKEEYPTAALRNSWNAGPAMKIVIEFERSLKNYPPIAPGTPDP